MRRLCNDVLAGYIISLAIGFMLMSIFRHGVYEVGDAIVVLLTLPWSVWLESRLDPYISEATDHQTIFYLFWLNVICFIGAGFLNALILFGISRLFKKTN